MTIVQSQLEIPSDVRRTSRGSLYRRTSVLPRMYYVELRDVRVVTPSLADRSFDYDPYGPHRTITMQSEVSLCCTNAKDVLLDTRVNGFLWPRAPTLVTLGGQAVAKGSILECVGRV